MSYSHTHNIFYKILYNKKGIFIGIFFSKKYVFSLRSKQNRKSIFNLFCSAKKFNRFTESEIGLSTFVLSYLRFMLDWLFAITRIVAFFVIQNWLVLLVTRKKKLHWLCEIIDTFSFNRYGSSLDFGTATLL